MATKTKAKDAVRTGAGKGGRRPPARVKRGTDIPLLPITVGAILLVFAIGLIVFVVANNKGPSSPSTVASIPCDKGEHSQVHYHSAVQIVYQGIVHPIPSNIGIVTDSSGNTTCLYWLHVHPANPNVIHIEAPASQSYTLGQFFAIWNSWSKSNGGAPEPLDATHVSTFTLTPDEKLVVYIDLQDGKGAQPYTGDPKAIVFRSHEVITLEITPPVVTPPPSFTFASGL